MYKLTIEYKHVCYKCIRATEVHKAVLELQ